MLPVAGYVIYGQWEHQLRCARLEPGEASKIFGSKQKAAAGDPSLSALAQEIGTVIGLRLQMVRIA
jgi:hypothetical protein